MFHIPIPFNRKNRNACEFRESRSDSSSISKNISHLSDQMRNSESDSMGGSSENITHYGSLPNTSTMSQHFASKMNHNEPQPINKFNALRNFKSHISHSTGDLNAKVKLALIDSNLTINDSQFFEVMYIGKIKVNNKKVPKTFIDDAIPKFKDHDAMKMKNLMMMKARQLERQNLSDTSSIQSDLKIANKDDDDYSDNQSQTSEILGDDKKEHDHEKESSPPCKISEHMNEPRFKDIPKRNRSASIGAIPIIEQNRTMVFLLGRFDLRLISPGKKQVLLHKKFKDVSSCVQGIDNKDHFGIICGESSKKGEYISYVFKCQCETVACDIVSSLSKSISIFSESNSPPDTVLEQVPDKYEPIIEHHEQLTCEHCPMVWYNRLCQTVEGLNEKKTFSTLIRFVETMSEDDQNIITQKYWGIDGINDKTTRERIEYLQTLLESHCQMRQKRHVHDTAENRSEFLNQYLGSSTIFTKAKRTLTNSFDHLLKRRGSKDIDEHNNTTEHEEIHRFPPVKLVRSYSVSPSIVQTQSFKKESKIEEESTSATSPKMDMFMKVGNNCSKNDDVTSTSWRQEILKNVVVPTESETSDSVKLLPSSASKKTKPREEKRTKEELRDLWKFAYRQVVLLKRMETENARLKRRQNEHELRKIKLEYDEIMPCDDSLIEIWDDYINQASRSMHQENKIFLQAMKSGVPRVKRGEVWLMLAEQYNKNHPPIDIDIDQFPYFTTPFVDLLKNLTEHQHAIFMDIGRTFPNHEFYKAPFGLGQLSLFNLLKAYSILDPEVGYCQGLAFICGVLLLHLTEKDAFYLLKHLMFKRQMRLKYLPDMNEFQLQLYQLSRLIKDHLPDLYQHLDKNEISPTLWASSWILTIFSSTFPFGFVSRVLDLLFFATDEVIFRVIIALLEVHNEELMNLEGFEDITEYLKTTIPQIDQSTMTEVFKKVYTLNIARQLSDFKIEYNVLKEEITQTNKHLENLRKSQMETKKAEKQLNIAQSNVDRLENIRQTQNQDIQKLQIQIRNMETTIQTLGEYITNLAINRTDIDVPSDIRRLLQQLELQQTQQRQAMMKRHANFADRKIPKSMSVNCSMGLKVLVEQNENEFSSAIKVKSPSVPKEEPPTESPSSNQPIKKKFFQNTYEQIRKQNPSFKLSEEHHILESPTEVIEKSAVIELLPTAESKQMENEKLVEDPMKNEDDQTDVPLQETTDSSSEENSQKTYEMTEIPPLMSSDISFSFKQLELKSLRSSCRKK